MAVVEGIAPELPGCTPFVRRNTGDVTVLKELGMREVVGTAGRHIHRQVADQTDAARPRVLAQRVPFALEAHLAGERAFACEVHPALRPVPVACGKLADFRLADRSVGLGEEALP